MTKLIKATLVLQFAIAGVAMGQMTDKPRTSDSGGWMGAAVSLPADTIRASMLIGTEVYNKEGKHLGEVKDIVLDRDGRRIGYAVLSYGGIAGLGDKLFAMPSKMLQYSATDKRATVSLSEEVLKNAPGFDKSKWPTEANADYYTKLNAYYKDRSEDRADMAKDRIDHAKDITKKDMDESAKAADKQLDRDASKDAAQGIKDAGARASARLGNAADDAKATADGTKDRIATPAAAQDLAQKDIAWDRRVSSVIGANVENQQGDNLGEVHDLVLDWNKGAVRYAVLSYGGIMGLGDKLFAVPIGAFHSQPDKSKLVLNVSKDQLKTAPGFIKDQWPNMADPVWNKSVGEFYKQNRVAPQAD